MEMEQLRQKVKDIIQKACEQSALKYSNIVESTLISPIAEEATKGVINAFADEVEATMLAAIGGLLASVKNLLPKKMKGGLITTKVSAPKLG